MGTIDTPQALGKQSRPFGINELARDPAVKSPGTSVYTDGTVGTAIAGSTFNGKFVGTSGDGPLGVLGTWEVPGFRGATNTANDLTGSFGADLTSFETPLP